jgi:hypothetical protein
MEDFMDLWSILRPIDFLWTFGVFCGNLVYFSPFWYIIVPRKSGSLEHSTTEVCRWRWQIRFGYNSPIQCDQLELIFAFWAMFCSVGRYLFSAKIRPNDLGAFF